MFYLFLYKNKKYQDVLRKEAEVFLSLYMEIKQAL